jgi:hypothetical protein
VYNLLIRHIGKICSVFQCTEFELDRLVQFGVITSEERYLVFSYPRSTVYNPLHRWCRLIEILRNNRSFLRLFYYFNSVLIPGITEIVDLLRYELNRHLHLREFAIELV